MLRRAPDRDAVRVGRRQKRVRLDGEVRDHRKRVVVLDDADRRCASSTLPQPNCHSLQRVRVRERIVRAAAPDPARAAPARSSAASTDRHRRQFLDIDANERSPRCSPRPSVRRRRPPPARRRTSFRPTASIGRSAKTGPYRGTGCGKSSAVKMPRTPGTRRASSV